MTPSLFSESRGSLVLGPYFPALEEAFLATVRARRDPLDPLWAIAPTGEMQRRLRSRLAASGGVLNVHFFGFESLAEELAAPAAARLGLAKLPAGGAFLLMEEILRDQDLGYFAPARNEARFSATLLATLRDLRDAGVSPETLSRAAKARLGPAGKLASLAAITQNWEKRLARLKLYDRSDAFRLAAQEVKEGRAALPAPFTLLVYGVADFTGAQRQLLDALAARAQTLHVFAPPESEYSRPSLAFFRGLGLEESAPIASEKTESEAASPRRISAAGRGEEVRECMREIAALLEAGVRPEEIGIVARNAAPYESILRDRFAAEKLPLAPAAPRTLAQCEAGEALLAAIRLREGPVSRRALFSWLQLPGLRLESLTGLADPPLVEWDRELREAGIAQFEKGWEKRAPLPGVRSSLRALESLAPSGALARVSSSLAQFASAHLADGESKQALVESIQSLAALEPLRKKLEPGELPALLEETLRESRAEPRSGGVFFGDAMRARGLSFRALFVLGLAAREFPRTPPFDPILLDAEREALAARFGAADLQPKSRAEEEEPFLFEGLRAAAREKLFLIRPRLDPVNGKEILPSPYWGEVKTEERAPLRFWSAASRGAPASLLEFDLRQVDALVRADREGAASYLREIFPRSAAPGLALEEQRWSPGRYTIYDGGVGPEIASKLAGLRFDGAISPTKLEALAGCPFRFFLESGLQIAPLEEPEAESDLDARDRGTLLHKILAEFFGRLEKGKTLDAIPRATLDAELERAFAEHWSQQEREGIPGAWADREALRQEMRRQLRDYLEKEIELHAPVPAEVEWEMPEGIEFRAGRHLVPLRGQVDRIDAMPDGSGRIVDFKSGNQPDGGVATLQEGRRLQGPLYAYAAQKTLGLSPIACEYHYFKKGKRSRLAHDGDSALLRETVEALLDLGRAGVFPQLPDFCKGCQVKLACPSEAKPLWERKQGDPALGRFLALHSGEMEKAWKAAQPPREKKPRAKKAAKKGGEA